MPKLMTLSDENQFEFTCPIFNTDVKMAGCMLLREKKWMGQGPAIRRGCQAAMTACKCPAAAIVDQINYGRFPDGVPDNYGSKTPVKGKLRADILERILRPMVLTKTVDDFGVSPAERTLLLSANDRIAAQLKSAPAGEGKYVARNASLGETVTERRRPVRTRTEAPKPANDTLADAARTGDMAAAING
jgi:hypothetical protein